MGRREAATLGRDMTREQARTLLGVSDNATQQEIARAYRHLMATVHPDVCRGPEAERLARQASEARQALLAPEISAPHVQENREDVDDQQLMEIVVVTLCDRGGILTKTGIRQAVLLELMAAGFGADRSRTSSARVSDREFLEAGAVAGLWEIRGEEVWLAVAASGSRVTEGEAPKTPPRAGEPAPLGLLRWLAAVAASALMVLVGVGGLGMLGGVAAANWPWVAVCTVGSGSVLVAVGWITWRFQLAEDAFSKPTVIVPGVVCGFVLLALLLDAFS